MYKLRSTITTTSLKAVILFLALISGYSLLGQVVTGRVVDNQTSEPLPYANVFSKSDDLLTSTDGNGYFTFSYEQGSLDSFFISYVGYPTTAVDISTIMSQKLGPVVFRLKAFAKLSVIEVTASNSVTSSGTSVLSSSIKDLEKVPALLGEYDPLKALAFLPGLSSGFEGTSSLNIRGGNSNQTNLVIDDIQLLNVNHVGGFISAVPGFGLKSATVYKGGLPGRFGGRLSGTVDFRYRNGRRDKFSREHTVGTGLVRLGMEGPVGPKSSYLINARLGYPFLISTLLKGESVRKGVRGTNQHVVLGDFIGKWTSTFGQWDVSFTSFLSGDQGYDQFESNSQISLNEYGWGNQAYAIKGHRFFGVKTEFSTHLSYLNYRQNIRTFIRSLIEDDDLLDRRDRVNFDRYVYNTEVSHFINSRFYLTGGLELIVRQNTGTRSQRLSGIFRGGLSQISTSVGSFIQGDLSSNNGRLQIMAALRIDAYENNFIGYYIQPRLRGQYQIGNRVFINAGYDKNVQFENQLQTTQSLFPTDLFILSNTDIAPSESQQVHIGVAGDFGSKEKVEWSAEVFHKEMYDLIRIRPGQESSTTIYDDISINNYSFNGSGRATGLELYIQKNQGSFNYSLAYTLSKSTRSYSDINDGEEYPFSFDRRHDINVQASKKVNEKWSIIGNFIYQTGIAFTSPILSSAQFDIFDLVNNSRYPSFHRLDASAVKSWYGKKNSDKLHQLTFSVYNVYARKNAYFVGVSIERNEVVDSITGDVSLEISRKVQTRSLFGFLPGVSYKMSL